MPDSYVVLLPQEDGSASSVEVTGRGGTAIVAEPWKAETLAGGKKPVDVSEAEVRETFAKALAAAPAEPSRFILYFESDTATLTPKSRAQLKEILVAVKSRPTPDVDVVGHTDTFGADRYNDELAESRAKRIREEIVKIGVDPKMIEVSSHGKRDPLVKTANGVHEPRNRRVEVIVR